MGNEYAWKTFRAEQVNAWTLQKLKRKSTVSCTFICIIQKVYINSLPG